MNYYIKLVLSLGLSSFSLFASHNHGSEIKELEAQAFKKLTAQLCTNIPADITPELDRLHEIHVEQTQEKYDSLQKTTAIFGAATIGALFIGATKRAPSSQPISYRSSPIAAEGEASRVITGLEIPALLSLLPSTQTFLYGSLALGGLFALYEANRAIHAPCRAKFELAEYKVGRKLEFTEQKQEELRKTLVAVQTENEQTKASLSTALVKIKEVKLNQTEAKRDMGAIGTTLSGIQDSLQSMQKKAYWDLSKTHERVAALKGLKEQQESMQLSQEIDAMIHETEVNGLIHEIDFGKGIDSQAIPTGPQRSVRSFSQPHVISGAGVFPARKPVDEVGYFGCCGKSLPKKHTELR